MARTTAKIKMISSDVAQLITRLTPGENEKVALSPRLDISLSFRLRLFPLLLFNKLFLIALEPSFEIG